MFAKYDFIFYKTSAVATNYSYQLYQFCLVAIATSLMS